MKIFKKIEPLMIMMGITAVCITASAIIFEQSVIRVVPLYISLVILFFQSRINRYVNIIAGINSIWYAAIYVIYKLYGMAAYALLFNFPLSIITFIKWNKNAYGKSTLLKTMNKKQKIFTALAFVASVAVMTVFLSFTDTKQALLDSITTLLGIFASVIMLLSFSEYITFGVMSNILSVILHIKMIIDGDLEQVAYLIFDIYAVACLIKATLKAKHLVKEQANINKIE